MWVIHVIPCKKWGKGGFPWLYYESSDPFSPAEVCWLEIHSQRFCSPGGFSGIWHHGIMWSLQGGPLLLINEAITPISTRLLYFGPADVIQKFLAIEKYQERWPLIPKAPWADGQTTTASSTSGARAQGEILPPQERARNMRALLKNVRPKCVAGWLNIKVKWEVLGVLPKHHCLDNHHCINGCGPCQPQKCC